MGSNRFDGLCQFPARQIAPETLMHATLLPDDFVCHRVKGARSNGDEKRHLWSGAISSVSISNGKTEAGSLMIDKPMTSPVRIVDANADALNDTYKPVLSWEKPSQVVAKGKSGSPKLEAVADFLHTLINSNEFFYLP